MQSLIRRSILSAILFSLAGFISLLYAPVTQAGTAASFNVSCPLSHQGPDDPIVFPGKPGFSHLHNFYGNTSTNAFSTTQTLLLAPSTCIRGFENTDHSGYWIPSLLVNTGAGTQPLQTAHLTVYYQGDGSVGEKITPFPQGFRMIAGDDTATTPQSTNIVSWHCGAEVTGKSATIPDCGSSGVVASIRFPNCWDGKDLDSPDHKSHVAYMVGKSCPADHPVRIPSLLFSASFKNVNAPASDLELSSGGQLTMHADFFAAWDENVLSALVNSCLNIGKHCNGENLSQVNVAGTTAGSGGAILTGQTQTTAQQPQNLPATGSSAAVGSGAALSILGTALFYYRQHRQALRKSLRHQR